MNGAIYRAGLTAAVLLALCACGERDAPESAATAPAAATDPATVTQAQAEAAFAATCAGMQGTAESCACVRDRIVAASGVQGLAYIAAAFSADPAAAAPYEQKMSQDDRNDAAEAFLNGQFDCVMAQDPDYQGTGAPGVATDAAAGADGAPPPVDTADESPFEAAVTACVEAKAASEPTCRCRVQSVSDALGEDGLRLSRLVDAGDDAQLRTLAEDKGADWLSRGRETLQSARAACGG